MRPVEPMLVARLAVLAQASAYVGAVFAGRLGRGAAARRPRRSAGCRPPGATRVTAVIGVVCSAALVAAALWLESVCRVPPDEEHDPPEGVAA